MSTEKEKANFSGTSRLPHHTHLTSLGATPRGDLGQYLHLMLLDVPLCSLQLTGGYFILPISTFGCPKL